MRRRIIEDIVQTLGAIGDGEMQAESPNMVAAEPADTRTDLERWWAVVALEEVTGAQRKASEYGSYDLVLLGQVLGDLMDWEVTEQEATVLGCFFYLQGKVARMASALQEGRMPGYDTLHDTSVYVKMLQRVVDHGSWP